MEEKKCKSCAMMIPKEAKVCPHCRKKQQPGACVMLMAIFGVLFLIGYISNLTQTSSRPSPPVSNQPSPPTKPLKKQSAADHLADARKALADGYKPDKDPMKTTWGRVSDAKTHLAAIPPGSPEKSDAEKLSKEVARREKEIDKVTKLVVDKAAAKIRQNFAESYERSLLDKGLDAHVSVSGKSNDTLKVKWVLVSRPLVHKLINDADFISKLRSSGFKKLIMSDGYNESWKIDL